MSDFTIEQLAALEAGTIPGPWAAIADHPYISIVIANDEDQIHAPIVDITDGLTDEPEVNKHHELMAAAPALVDALIAEKRAHGKLRAGVQKMRDWYIARSQRMQSIYAETFDSRFADYAESYEATADMLNDILEENNG